MIASVAMLAIMAGCAVYLFLKGTLTQGLIMILNAVVAGFVAFGFYEMAVQYLVKYSPGMAVWAPLICFLLLLVLTFAVLQAVATQISKEKLDFGERPEQIGRLLAGVVLGYLVTGYVLVAAALAPLPSAYPYARFDERTPNPARPARPLLSPDGFVAGLFGTVSKGSFSAVSNPRSFAVLHAGYLDQLYLNRHKVTQKVTLATTVPALDVPAKNGVWYAPENLRDTAGKPLSGPAGTSLMLVRANFRRSAFRDSSKCTLSQIRVVCALKSGAPSPLAGQGQAVYPIGYVGSGGRLERKSLAEMILLENSGSQGDTITMDLAFYVPTHLTPVLLEFKRNNVVQLSAPAAPENAPTPIPFGTSAPPAVSTPEPAVTPPTSPALPPSSDNQRPRRGLSDISRSIVGDGTQEN
jgi:hypothetical protein